MLNIGMIDADLIDNGTRHPNLAQMKMSAYCKSLGHETRLLFDDLLYDIEKYDILIISKVFTFTKLPENIAKFIPDDKEGLEKLNGSIVETLNQFSSKKPENQIILIGGTGFFEFGGRDLEEQIELRQKPDYKLYDEYVNTRIEQGYQEKNFDDYRYYSIGFTTRGCFRQCPFCVNRKYKKAKKNTPLKYIVDENRPRIYLWDDNLLAYGVGWEQILAELNMTGKPFQFRQGLDIRLMTEKRAKILDQSMYYGDYIFAFDNIEEKERIVKGLRVWRKYCKKTTKLYVLCAFYRNNLITIGENDEEIQVRDIIDTFERIKILMEYGCIPYIMRYEDYKKSIFKDLYIQLARWCNQPQFFKKKSFRQFCEANRDYAKTDKCASYKAMINFEEKYPNIAKDYFDLKFEEINQYDLSYNYGRIKSEPCSKCILSSLQWDQFVDNKLDTNKWISSYFEKSLDHTCLIKPDAHCNCHKNITNVCKKIIDTLLKTSDEDIIKIIESFPITTIDVSLIPQFSNYDDGTENIIQLLTDGPKNYEEIGSTLRNLEGRPEANKKYGENHSKLATLMDLTYIREEKNKKIVYLSPLGRYCNSLSSSEHKEIFRKLLYRIPIIQQLIVHSKERSIKISEIMKMSGAKESTIKRRTPDVTGLISQIMDCNNNECVIRLGRIH